MAQSIITGTRLFVVVLFLLRRRDGVWVGDTEVVTEKCKKTKTKLKSANEETLHISMIG